MFLVVGLGNPGAQYEQTRHNVGFWALDKIVEKLGSSNNWKTDKLFFSIQSSIDDTKIILCKPQTFMNLSGDAVVKIISFYKIEPANIIVYYDDLDLPPGSIRVRKGGGAGGHKGIQDIVAKISFQDFYRVRIGIGRPELSEDLQSKKMSVSSWVLAKPNTDDTNKIEAKIIHADSILKSIIENGLEKTQQVFNS